MKTQLSPSTATGSLGIMHLKRYWEKQNALKNGELPGNALANEWVLDTTLLSALNLGLEQTITYLYRETPAFDDFEKWIAQVNNGQVPAEKIELFNRALQEQPEQNTDIEKVLTDDELAFWDANGYLIIRNAVPKEDADAAVKAICDYIGADITKPESWYKPHPAKQGVMVQLFQHEALEKNRRSEKVRKVYEQLWGRKDLWLNTDRAGFNPPETDFYRYQGFPLHWDVSLKLPIPFGLQGILYLTDTAAHQGAFTLVPGFQHRIEDWLNSLPEGTDPREEDMYALGAVPIAANAGDFIVWHHALPHGSSPNRAGSPRVVQYVNYTPVNAEIKKQWI